MPFDIVTWSIEAVGLVIWIIWAYLSIKEFIYLFSAREHKEEGDKG